MLSRTQLKKMDINANGTNYTASSQKGPTDPTDHTETKRQFSYPDCWQDAQRMSALMAPFRLRSVNVENYDGKMQFWQDLIAQYCKHKGSASFNLRELKTNFSRGERVPACLDTVLEEMLKNKKIRLLAEYEYDPENSWTGWAISSLVRKPLSWGYTKIKYSVGFTNEQAQSSTLMYVHLDVMKYFCKELQTKVLQHQQGKLLHYEAFQELVKPALQILENCLTLCLHTLHVQHKIGVEYSIEEGERQLHLIKIPSKADRPSVIITEVDRAIHNLQMTQENLIKQLEVLEQDIKQNEAKAREYVNENKRQLAKTYLRKKHLLEKNHEKRSLALHNIETLLSSVDEAQSNGEILDAYKIGSKALQKALDTSGLKYDNVDEVISEVQDTMDMHNELQETLKNTHFTDGMTNYDNEELERELQEILGETGKESTAGTAQNVQKPGTIVVREAEKANASKVPVNVPTTSIQVPIGTISDATLLAMLEGLEMEEDSIAGSTQNNTSKLNI